jgi:hypothetical protein
MPPILIPIISAAGAYIGGLAGAIMIMEAAAIAYTITGLIAVGLYQHQKRKARDAYNSQLRDRMVMTAMADAPARRIYGRVRASGSVLFKQTSGPRKEFYTLVVVFADHEVDGFEAFYLNDQEIVVDANGLVQSQPYGGRGGRLSRVIAVPAGDAGPRTLTLPAGHEDAAVSKAVPGYQRRELVVVSEVTATSITFQAEAGVPYTVDYTVPDTSSVVSIIPFYGAPGQNISSLVRQPNDLAFNDLIADTDRFEGKAGVVMSLSYDPTAFPQGVPSVSAVVRGARVLDPRNGGVLWSDNPALCALDWAKHPNGGDCQADEVDEASFIAAANACDVMHSYTVNGAVVSRRLYRCGYVCDLTASPDVHMGELVEAMAGKQAWANGRLRVRAGVYTAPVVTIDEAWLAGPVSISRGVAQRDLVNVYRPSIADEAQSYTVVQLPELRIQSYIDADGRDLPQEVSLSAVNFAPQALHICGVFARDLRQGMSVDLVLNMRALQLDLFDVVRLTIARYGWNLKTFEVLAWRFNPSGLIQVTLKETQASIYSPDAAFVVESPSDNSSLPLPWQIGVPWIAELDSGEQHLLLQSDGSVLTRVLVRVAAVNDAAVLVGGFIDVQYSEVGSGVWNTQSFDGASTSLYLPGLQDGQWYQFRARLRSRLATGVWSPLLRHRVVGKTTPPPMPDSFRIGVQADGTRLLEGGYTTTVRPADFAGWQIRYRQGVGPFEWDQMIPFQTDNGFVTSLPVETNLLSAGMWSLALAAVDTTGNVSEPLQIVGVLPNPRLGDALTYFNLESIGWPGTLTDCVREVVEGRLSLVARDQATWADITSWSAWTRWSMNPVSAWSYQLDDEDLGSVISTLPVVVVDGEGQLSIEEQHSADGTSWTAWAPIAASFMARYVRIRVLVQATGPTGFGLTQVTYLRSMQVIYTAAVATEVFEDIDPSTLTGAFRIGVGDIRVPLANAYATVRVESVVIQSATGAWSWRLVDKSTSGPRLQFLNNGVLADPPLVDITTKGIRS